jgi:hypothetical protein
VKNVRLAGKNRLLPRLKIIKHFMRHEEKHGEYFANMLLLNFSTFETIITIDSLHLQSEILAANICIRSRGIETFMVDLISGSW